MKAMRTHSFVAVAMCAVLLSLQNPSARAMYTCQFTGRLLTYCCCKARAASGAACQLTQSAKPCCKKSSGQTQVKGCGCCKVTITSANAVQAGTLSSSSADHERRLSENNHTAAECRPNSFPAFPSLFNPHEIGDGLPPFQRIYLVNLVIRR